LSTSRRFIIAAALLAGLGVLAGAFGAHTLDAMVAPDRLQTFETGVRYQMYHALALLWVGWASTRWDTRWLTWAGYAFLAGIVIFCGSLYTLVLTDTPWLGAVTPLGGVLFIAGWFLLARGFLHHPAGQPEG
jgi:uncharacterized membrane protein YgdD (TMEM256/DUF423 family)